MVLKRLFISALGALGLGALAAGPAFGQGQIPAPDAYGDITNCDTDSPDPVNRPFGMGAYEDKSLLDTIFQGLRITQLAATGANSRASLNGQLNPCGDSPLNTNDIARNFSTARNLYADTAATVDGTDAYKDAKAKQDAFGGEVFDLVYNEAAARRAVDKAIDDFNDLVANPEGTASDGEFTLAKAARDVIDIDGYDTDTSTEGTVREYGSRQVRGFQSVSGFDNNNAIDTDVDVSGAFDTEGDLTFVQNVPTGAAGLVGVAGSTEIDTLGEISAQLAGWEDALAAAEDLLADTNPDTAATAYASRKLNVDRLTAVRDHVKDELGRLTTVAKRHAPISEIDDIIEYDAALATRQRAEDRVRQTAATLQSASTKAKDALEDPESYLEQLVKMRKFEKDAADKAVADAGANPSTALTTAAEDAADALTAAETQRDAYVALQGQTDNPAANLLKALLEPETGANGRPNPADDDGQALVTAISDTYDTAKDAKDTADGVASDVAGLTGEGGAVAMNTAAIETNKAAIATNTTDIATNKANIATNTADIATNKAGIASNKGMIETNTAGIATNKGMIADNASAIATNTGAIADLGNRVGANASAIDRNSGMIGELSESLETVRAGVAASMALAGMPAINGRGISIGVGSFDGESAFAVGFMIQGEMASFKVGVTSAGGATGASAGVGFQF